MEVLTHERTEPAVSLVAPGTVDLKAWEDLHGRLRELEQRVTTLEAAPCQTQEDRVAIIVFSGNMDRTIAAFIIATGAAAMGMEVSMFFTFWGLSVIKRRKRYARKNLFEKGFTAMLPAGVGQLGLSQMNFFGAGAALMRKLMRDKHVVSLPELVATAQELGVRLVACDMTRELMGISDAELLPGVEHGGVATFLGDAERAKVTLFI